MFEDCGTVEEKRDNGDILRATPIWRALSKSGTV